DADDGNKKAEEEPQQPLEDTDKSQEEETNKEKSDKRDQANGASDKNEGEGMEEDEEDEYEVESIVDHKKTKKLRYSSPVILMYEVVFSEQGRMKYYIKWKGYPSDENTWEFSDNLNCSDLVQAYWLESKERNNVKDKKKKHKTKGGSSKRSETPEPVEEKDAKRQRIRERTDENDKTRRNRAKNTREKSDNEEDEDWDNQITSVETVTRDEKSNELMVYLRWKNGDTSKHTAKEANRKCPQKMIKFYEQRLTFAPAADKKA
ncbi:1080_t:CDS:2, partial [Paraglomus brasilianum]